MRFVSPNPQTTPPLHGTEPHGQGTVAVTQLNPDSARPYSSDPAGGTSPNQELIVVGRSRGEQRADGTYHGHITIAAIGGNEILGVDTNPGETKTGPLTGAQQAILTPLCTGTMNSVCLGAVIANSTTTTTGSTNHFETLSVKLGGASGIDASAASSDGNISSDGTCQTATGKSQVAKVKAGTTVAADLVRSKTISVACNDGRAPTQTDTSTVINLFNTGLPIPPGCSTGGPTDTDPADPQNPNGTPNTVTGVPTILPIVCNADDSSPGTNPANGAGGKQTTDPYGVREALDVFLLANPGVPPLVPATSAAKLTTAAAESHAVAPARAVVQPPPPPPPPPPTTVKPTVKPPSTKKPPSGNKATPAANPGPAVKAAGGNLPFTGSDLLPFGLAGLVLLGGGLALRSRTGQRRLGD